MLSDWMMLVWAYFNEEEEPEIDTTVSEQVIWSANE